MEFLKYFLRDEAGDGAEGGGGSPAPEKPAFDPAAFQTAIMEQVNRTVNSLDKRHNKHFEALNASIAKLTATPAEGGGETTPAVARQPQAQGQTAEMTKLRASLEQLQEASKKKDLQVAVTSAVANLDFNSAVARKDFAQIVGAGLVFDPDGGGVVGPSGESVEDFVRAEYASRPHLLPPKAVGGSGAMPSSRGPGFKGPEIENIKPGMSQADRDAVREQILRALPGSGRGY